MESEVEKALRRSIEADVENSKAMGKNVDDLGRSLKALGERLSPHVEKEAARAKAVIERETARAKAVIERETARAKTIAEEEAPAFIDRMTEMEAKRAEAAGLMFKAFRRWADSAGE